MIRQCLIALWCTGTQQMPLQVYFMAFRLTTPYHFVLSKHSLVKHVSTNIIAADFAPNMLTSGTQSRMLEDNLLIDEVQMTHKDTDNN